MLPKPNTSFYITVLLLAVVIVYIILSEHKLKSDGILLIATTTHWATSAKMGMDLKYEFYYKGKKITGANAFEPFRGNSEFENRHFPVIYYPGLGGSSELLIRPADFKRFNIPFPDSLAWVLKYLSD